MVPRETCSGTKRVNIGPMPFAALTASARMLLQASAFRQRAFAVSASTGTGAAGRAPSAMRSASSLPGPPVAGITMTEASTTSISGSAVLSDRVGGRGLAGLPRP